MLRHRLNPTIHRYEDVELVEVHSEYLECRFRQASRPTTTSRIRIPKAKGGWICVNAFDLKGSR